VAVLRIDQRERWRLGERIRVEAYLARFPSLSEDPTGLLDLIYSEFMLREAAGERPSDEEFAERFPAHAPELKVQFALHRLAKPGAATTLPGASELEVELPETLVQVAPTHVAAQPNRRRRWLVLSSAAGAIATIAAAVVWMQVNRIDRPPTANRTDGETAQAATEPPHQPQPAVEDLLDASWLARLPPGWSIVEGELQSDGKVVVDNLKLKAIRSRRYRIECEFSATDAHDAFYLMLPVGERQCFFGVNAFPNGPTDTAATGFGEIDGKSIDANPTGVRRPKLRQGERHRLVIDVDVDDDTKGGAARLGAALDDLPPIVWSGPAASLSAPYTYLWPERQTFGLGAIQSSYRVHKLGYSEFPDGWPRHAIDDASKGADGVRLADIDGDGLLDIATGWEQGGVARIYLNPGPEKASQRWPAVTVGPADDVEDAAFVDLDGDGAIDAATCSEGEAQVVSVHWAPRDLQQLLDAGAWRTETLPASANRMKWMFALPMQVDEKHGVDLVVGGKGKGAAIGWFESPPDPRRLADWRWRELRPVGWLMSLVESDMDGDGDIVFSDRRGKRSGAYWLENPGAPHSPERPWTEHPIGGLGEEAMFLSLADLDADGREDVLLAVRPKEILWLRRLDREGKSWRPNSIPLPEVAGNAKAVSAVAVAVEVDEGD
jgi:hypothetical protein